MFIPPAAERGRGLPAREAAGKPSGPRQSIHGPAALQGAPRELPRNPPGTVLTGAGGSCAARHSPASGVSAGLARLEAAPPASSRGRGVPLCARAATESGRQPAPPAACHRAGRAAGTGPRQGRPPGRQVSSPRASDSVGSSQPLPARFRIPLRLAAPPRAGIRSVPRGLPRLPGRSR